MATEQQMQRPTRVGLPPEPGSIPPTQESLIVTGASACSADGRAAGGGREVPVARSPPNGLAPKGPDRLGANWGEIQLAKHISIFLSAN